MVTPLQAKDSISLKNIMVAIQGVLGALEPKIDSVGTEVALMRADFHKLGALVKEAADSQKEVKASEPHSKNK
ncbi:hypothetical protein NDU88_006918 [Pleurodeles waltl]|uniref:Uncharacterized protein n=1 Tax=Pleurodeles waltl TaxID=8319 RepID=A0AAV7QNB5_PLEWA|nr:hypothetical protein NDU88_006918 [Pleurodeles waltl]